jgi:aspartyl-tRNA(Asn)/glutamyl-tRNA(Gln) amidotransferase subunit A
MALDLRTYASLSTIEMAEIVRRGETTATELVQCALDAIEATDKQLNAWSEVFPEAALERAKELDAEARKGHFAGPLHGVPVGIKDLFQVAGTHTRRGSRFYEHDMAKETGPAVERTFAAGAIMVGKTTTAELGWKASSNSLLQGVTRNPWDVSRTTGGSSAGSAAVVAAGVVPFTLGGDGGGSLRIPASFCGIFSMKAHVGRMPTWPLSPAEQLSCVAPMTNTVADYALGMDLLQGPDPRDPNSLPPSGVSYRASLFDIPSKMRCVLAPTLFGARVQPEVAEVVEAAFRKIRAMPDVQVVGTQVDWPDPIATFDALWVARASLYKDLDPAKKALFDPGFQRQIALSAKIRVEDHLKTLKARAEFVRAVAESFRDFDLVLVPMVPIEPFAAEKDGPPDMDESPPVPWARWTPFSHPFNVSGQPAASIPCGWTKSGLPVGLQVIGGRFDELRVLQFCAAWEKVFDWRARRPKVFAGDVQ